MEQKHPVLTIAHDEAHDIAFNDRQVSRYLSHVPSRHAVPPLAGTISRRHGGKNCAAPFHATDTGDVDIATNHGATAFAWFRH
jgi:hypothetical protein